MTSNGGWMAGYDRLPVAPLAPLPFPVFCGHHGTSVEGRAYPRPPGLPPSRLLYEVARGSECWACDVCAQTLGLKEGT